MANFIRSRRFFPLLITQFLGALNDNLFKNALLTYVAVRLTEQSDLLSNVIAGVFILPFFLFSAMAGALADKISRDRIARVLKITEVLLMGGVAVAYYGQNLILLVILMALMGMQSAFFGPVKYALLPQQLHRDELIGGNACIEASTYIAILMGLILGTLLPMSWSIGLLLIIAVAGVFSARLILPAQAPRPTMRFPYNPLVALKENYKFLRRHRLIFQSILGASWFWLIGAFAAVQIYPLCAKVLSAGNGTMTFFLVMFSCGIAVGSYACNRLLKGVINMVYVPVSAVGMAFCLFGLWLLSSDYPKPDHLMSFVEFLQAPRAFGLSLCLFMLAFFGGLYVIPLNAFMQKYAPRAYTATVIAGNNIFNSLAMVGAAVLSLVLLGVGFSLPWLFCIVGLLGLGVAVGLCALLPDHLTRSILQTILRFLFRTEVLGIENFYRSGPRVLIISNHVSLWDGVLMAAFIPERITFAITSAWTGRWFMPIIRVLADFYPLDPTNPLSIRKLIGLMKQGKKVMIFPEGRITLTGKVMQVYDGAALAAVRAEAKILPVRIDGAEYSSFSYVRDKLKTHAFPKIKIHVLPARTLKTDSNKASRGQAGRQLYRLMTEAEVRTTPVWENLYTALTERKNKIGGKSVLVRGFDGRSLSLGSLLSRAVRLAETLRPRLENMQSIGISLQNPFDFMLTVTALDYLGKNMIVYGDAELESEARIRRADCLLVSGGPNRTDMLTMALPKRMHMLFGRCRASKPTPSTITFFENGQAVDYLMRDLIYNQVQLAAVMPVTAADRVVCTVPFSWASGFVEGVLLPLMSGAETIFYAGRHTRLVSHLCYDFAATVLVAHRDVLQTALEEASPFDFFNVRFVLFVGEKVSEQVADDFLHRFGIRILENAVDTQKSALLRAVNTPMYYRFGTCGQLLPLAQSADTKTDDEGFVCAPVDNPNTRL